MQSAGYYDILIKATTNVVEQIEQNKFIAQYSFLRQLIFNHVVVVIIVYMVTICDAYGY